MGRGGGKLFARLKDGVLAVALLFLGILIVAKLDGLNETRSLGVFMAIDGDTLSRHGERYRIVGIDAPELQQTCRRGQDDWACGQDARAYLAAVMGEGSLACTGNSRDRYRRLLVRCRAGDVDLGAAMVAAGLAVRTEYFLYGAEERQAQSDARGLWGATFEMPSDWRRERKAADIETPLAGFAELVRSLTGW